jgi:predicted phage terminase large subunit-like protein
MGIHHQGAKSKRSLYEENLPRQIMLEQITREKQRRRLESIKSYSDWLKEASPELNWDFPHLKYIQGKLDAVTNGDIKRLMLLVPYQHGKSSIVTSRYPGYLLEKNPKTRIAIAAATSDLAETFSRQIRNLVTIRGIVELDITRQAVDQWLTLQGGGLKAIGSGGQIVGFPADVIIIDDPVKNYEAANSKTVREAIWNWYANDIYSRQQRDTPIILIMTHWNEDDLAGRLIAQDVDELDPMYKWTVVRLPAIYEGTDPEDYPIKRKMVNIDGREVGEALCEQLHPLRQLLNFQRVMGHMFSAGYQQRPAPLEGKIWKKAWFCEGQDSANPLRTVNKFPTNVKITQMWDTALDTKERNDPSAMVEGCMVEGNIYVAAMVNEKMEFPELIQRMRTESERVNSVVEICVEDKANAKPARQQLKLKGIPLIEVPSGTVDKVVRAKSVSHYGESGFVIFVNLPGNCNDDLLYQLLIFDNGRHDDLHDAFVHLLRRLTATSTGWDSETLQALAESLSND